MLPSIGRFLLAPDWPVKAFDLIVFCFADSLSVLLATYACSVIQIVMVCPGSMNPRSGFSRQNRGVVSLNQMSCCFTLQQAVVLLLFLMVNLKGRCPFDWQLKVIYSELNSSGSINQISIICACQCNTPQVRKSSQYILLTKWSALPQSTHRRTFCLFIFLDWRLDRLLGFFHLSEGEVIVSDYMFFWGVCCLQLPFEFRCFVSFALLSRINVFLLQCWTHGHALFGLFWDLNRFLRLEGVHSVGSGGHPLCFIFDFGQRFIAV